MLNIIRITGFKCIDTANLSLRPLTILAGPNASGKSSLIQAILLAYSVCHQKNQAYLKDVVKPYAHFEDVFCRFTNASTIEIHIEENTHCISLTMMEKLANFKTTELEEGYEESLFYLGAHRTGPEDIAELNKELRIGQHGQYALGLLEQLKDKPVHAGLVCNQAPAKTLKAQLAWWLSYIAGVQTEARTEKITSTSVKTTFNSEGIEAISPMNTGAGNNYLLKLLIMCLSASPGHTLLIENPEIHLHPGAQSRLGRLFAFLTAAGVQLVVETHCEHLISRIRHEIFNNNLSADKAIIYYKSDARTPFNVIEINDRGHFCDSSGEETRFPAGFFDATLDQLLEIQ